MPDFFGISKLLSNEWERHGHENASQEKASSQIQAQIGSARSGKVQTGSRCGGCENGDGCRETCSGGGRARTQPSSQGDGQGAGSAGAASGNPPQDAAGEAA